MAGWINIFGDRFFLESGSGKLKFHRVVIEKLNINFYGNQSIIQFSIGMDIYGNKF